MQQLTREWNDRVWRRTLAVMAGGLILFYMLCPVAPLRWADLYAAYGKTAIIAMAAIYFFRARLDGVKEVKLVIWYTIWFFITRLLNTDYYLQNELELVISRVLCCVVLPVGLLLEDRERRILLDIMTAVMGGFYFVTALLSLYACVFGVFFPVGPEGVLIGLKNTYFESAFIYIVAWSTNRTISAVWFYLAWCMMIYEFFRCKNKLWRIPIVLAWFVFHWTLAFCFCRSIKLASCVSLAMLTILLGMQHLRIKKTAVKAWVIVLLAGASMLLCYKSYDWLTAGTAAIYNAMDVRVERTSDQYMTDSYKENTKDGQNFEDVRDLRTSITNVSRRSDIYKSAIPAIRDEPLRLLIGKYSSKVMDGPRRYLEFPYFHMHNFLLQTLMLTGVIGFLLAAAFSLLLAVRMIRLFFSTDPRAVLDIKLLTLPVSGILIYGMFETILFTQSADDRAFTDFRELFFFLLAGIVLAYSYELAPPAKRRRRV